jgi:hypothetical protein
VELEFHGVVWPDFELVSLSVPVDTAELFVGSYDSFTSFSSSHADVSVPSYILPSSHDLAILLEDAPAFINLVDGGIFTDISCVPPPGNGTAGSGSFVGKVHNHEVGVLDTVRSRTSIKRFLDAFGDESYLPVPMAGRGTVSSRHGRLAIRLIADDNYLDVLDASSTKRIEELVLEERHRKVHRELLSHP